MEVSREAIGSLLAANEKMANAIYDQKMAIVTLLPGTDDETLLFISRFSEIEAIKRYRGISGKDMGESREYIKKLMASPQYLEQLCGSAAKG